MIAYVTCLKHESDVIAYQLQHHYRLGIRHFYILLNGSDEATRETIRHTCAMFEATVRYVDDDDIAYRQPERMTMLCEMAFQDGCGWMIPVDADELLIPPDGMTLHQGLAAVGGEAPGYLRCPWVDYVPHPTDDSQEGNLFARWRYHQQTPRPQSKILVRWTPGFRFGDGHHLLVTRATAFDNPGFWMAHFPNRSAAFLRRKIDIIGKAFVARFGAESTRPQVTQYHALCADPDGFMAQVWQRVQRSWQAEVVYHPLLKRDDA